MTRAADFRENMRVRLQDGASAGGSNVEDRFPVGEIQITIEENEHMRPDQNGEDRFEARSREMPGLVTYGATKESARANFLELADDDFRNGSKDRKSRL